MALSGNSGTCTINGWQCRVSKTWYPTDGTWTAVSSLPSGLNVSISSPNVNNSTSSSGNKYGVRIKITTPSTTGIASITSVSLTFKLFKRSGTAVDLYASLRSTDSSDSSDTTDTFRTNAIGDEAVISGSSISTSSTSPSTHTITFTGSMSKGTSYYVFLYTKDTSGIYGMYANFITSCSCLYTKTSYLVSYNNNGYGGTAATQTKVYGETLTLRSFLSNTNQTNYKVTIDANGGSCSTTSITSTKTGTQKSWNTNSSGTGTSYTSKGSYTANAATTLYAIWGWTNNSITLPDAATRSNDSTSYTVTYKANGGSTTPSAQTLTKTTTYTFSKWSLGAAGASYTPTGNVTCQAQWTSVTSTSSVTVASGISRANSTATGYTVTFNANGGATEKESMTNSIITSYTFNGWLGSDGTTYKAGATYSTAANLTLTAQWASMKMPSSIALPSAVRPGYTFLGWATSSTATSGSTTYYAPTSDVTLYAIWSQDYSTIYYNDNGTTKAAQVYYNDNGTAKLCNVYYNNNGSKEVI